MRIIRAARYLFSLGLLVDRGRLLRAVVLMFAGYIAAPLAALALRSLTDSLLGRQAGHGADVRAARRVAAGRTADAQPLRAP